MAQTLEGEAQQGFQTSRRAPCSKISRRPNLLAASALWVTTTKAPFDGGMKGQQQFQDRGGVRASRLPVGSSQRRMRGFRNMARAMATRCFSPPDRAEGRWSARSVRPSWSSSSRPRRSAAAGSWTRRHRVRDLDVFERGQVREQAVILQDEADLLKAKVGAALLVETVDVGVAEEHPARSRRFQAGQGVEKRALAAARGAEDGAGLLGRDREGEIAQDIDARASLAVASWRYPRRAARPPQPWSPASRSLVREAMRGAAKRSRTARAPRSPIAFRASWSSARRSSAATSSPSSPAV